MEIAQVSLISFGSLSLCALACGLVLRDLVLSGLGKSTPTRSLRRGPDPFELPPTRTFLERVDRGFDLLVLESGSELSSLTVFLMMVACGLAIGGGSFLYGGEPLEGVLGGMVGMALPLLWMAIVRARRYRGLREQLPHVLDMLARATRAGQSIDQAIHLVAHEAGGLLGQEFRRCEQQLEMGRSFDKCIKALANRVRLMELRILATTLIVQRQCGGPLSEMLERMGTVVRERIAAQRQVRATTAAGRMSTLIVASIAPLALVGLLAFQREHIDVLFQDPFGQTLLLLAIVLEVIGLIWVMLLLRTDH